MIKKLFFVFLMFFALSFAFACGEDNNDDKQNETLNEYTVTFVVNGEKTEVKVKDGEKASKPNDPVKEGYTFVGWFVGEAEYAFDAVTSNVTVTAKFEEVIVEYTVKFVADGEETLVAVKEGEKAVKPTDPKKDGYIFLGWYLGEEAYDFEKAVTSDLELIAKFEEEIKEYSVKFVVDSEETIAKVVEGEKVAKPQEPVKEGFEFLGWYVGEELFDFEKAVTSDLELVAKFEEVVKYKVTFADEDGNVIEIQYVLEGEAATEPEYEKLEGYDYFWDDSFNKITKDVTITLYKEILVFKVTFVAENGNLIEIVQVNYGQDAVLPTYDEEIYEAKYEGEYTNIKSDVTIKCIYTKMKNSIKYYDGVNELELSPSSYKSGDEFDLPVPEKAGYAFIGWFLSDISQTKYTKITAADNGDFKLYARFIETEKQNPIVLPASKFNFQEIKKVKHSSGDFYVYQPQLPSGATAGVQSYNWATSDNTIATVSQWSTITIASNGYCILSATSKTDESYVINCIIKTTSDGIEVVSEEEANKIDLVNVTFKGKNGEIIDKVICNKGGAVVYPKPISYDGLMFNGWDKNNYNIQEDTVITATYKEGTNNYEGKTFAIIGDSISTYQNYIPSGFASFYPYPTADVTDVNLTWWMQVINKVGGSLFVNNSYSGTCVADGSSNATKNKSRLKHCIIGEQTPDVILIFMGANDCASQYVTDTAFNQGYTIMLNNLKEMCPDSEIILCTLPQTKYYSNANQAIFNKVITDHAEKFELKVVDCSTVSIANHLVDSAHPNTEGMTVVANQMIKELLK